MLTALTPRRISLRLCVRDNAHQPRCYATNRDGQHVAKPRSRVTRHRLRAIYELQEKEKKVSSDTKKESGLYEQLFGPSSKEQEASPAREREVPRIPLDTPTTRWRGVAADSKKSDHPYRRMLETESERDEPGISVLVLRNASKNLVEEDFRRLIPQGSHLEGWTLEQGDILKVIPGRDPVTLERSNFYYLLFSSALSAFTYQGHATRVHKIVASHTPSSILSPMMPPPGIVSDKVLDVNTAIQSFSLVAPNHALDLRQLRPPLSPLMRAIVRNRGYPFLTARKDRMPFEARLTMEGPQLHESAIKVLFRVSGKSRELPWSGNDRQTPMMSKWVPPQMESYDGRLSGMSHKPAAQKWGERQEFREQNAEREHAELFDPEIVDGGDTEGLSQPDANFLESQGDKKWQEREQPTYIIGFPTERAMQSFVHCWHRRPMVTDGFEHSDSDLPAIANVEALW